MEVLSQSAIDSILKNELYDWVCLDGFIERHLEFKNFDKAFEFMTKVALVCKAQNHHPNWNNKYKQVSIKLRTADAGGITEKDITLAKSVDQLFLQF